MGSHCSLWALIQCDWCPYDKREIWTQTHREERPREVRRGGWSDVATAKICLEPQDLEEAGRALL